MAGIADQMRGLPMEDLIGGPLQASCIAQYSLAETMVTFIRKIGLTDDGGTQTLDFKMDRPVDNGSGTLQVQNVEVKAPILGLVPIPALLIETIDINFTMEVKSATSSASSTDASVEAEAHYGFGGFGASIKGSVSTHKENTRSTDNSAKYVVNVVAKQQPQTEGMSKLMDLISSAVDPLKLETSAAP